MREIGAVFNGITINDNGITIFYTPKKSEYLRAGEVYEMRFEVPLTQEDKNLIVENCEEVTKEKLVHVLDSLTFKK